MVSFFDNFADQRAYYELRLTEDAAGVVDSPRRKPLVMPQPADDQSDPAPWWVVASLPLWALALVGACTLFVRYVVPMIEAVL